MCSVSINYTKHGTSNSASKNSTKYSLNNKTLANDEQSYPGYLALYGLTESAFSKKPDDKFFYLGTEQARRLTELKSLILDRNLILNIRGARGIGKSSLIKRFVKISDKSLRFSYFSAKPKMNSDQMFFNVSAGFGLSGIADDDTNFKQVCINNIKYLEDSGVTPILIIDNVQRFAIDTLKSVFELVNRWDKNHPKLRIILLSDLSFKETLEQEKIKHLRILISNIIELEPLSKEQVERYIHHRLAIAGLDGSNPISRKACSAIFDKSKGIPKRINHYCHLALNDGMTEMGMKDFFDGENFSFPIRKYLVTGSIMAIFLGVLFSVFDENRENQEKKLLVTPSINQKINESDINSVKATISTPKAAKSITVTKVLAPKIIYDFTQIKLNLTKEITAENLNKIAGLQVVKKSTTTIKVKSTEKPKKKLSAKNNASSKSQIIKPIKKKSIKKPKIVKLTKTTKSSTVSAKKTPVRAASVAKKKEKQSNNSKKYDVSKLTTITSKSFPEIISVKPLLLSSVKSERTVSLFGAGFGKKSKVTIYGNGILKEMHETKIKYISSNQINIKIIPSDYPRKNWIVITDPKKGKSNSKLFEITRFIPIKSNLSIQDSEWILAQKGNMYILHVLGSKDKSKIVNFKHFDKIKGQLAVFVNNRNNEKWYHLIVGVFKSRYEAKLAMQDLPPTANKPWISPIREIQKVIYRLNQKTASSSQKF